MSASAESERKPSVFQVGDDLMALPEVFSVLDFGADGTFAADDDIEGQIRLRDSRYWGRLYLDGWPQSIQYFRAHFGLPPPRGRKRLIFAEPRDACSDLTNTDQITSDTILLAQRGTCTFGSKAKIAQSSGASGVIIINNEPGLDHLPGPDAHDIQFTVLSIPQPEGLLLESYYSNKNNPVLEGLLVPINCDDVGSKCDAATVEERKYIKNIMVGGLLNIYRTEKDGSLKKIGEDNNEYLIGHFGVKLPMASNILDVIVATPAEACTPLENSVSGKVVLVRRGKCSFVKKAEEVQAAGGAAMVVGSAGGLLVRMGVEPRWKGLSTTIPVAMISKRVYSSLIAEVYSGGSKVSFTDSAAVNGTFWNTLEVMTNGENWPRSEAFITKKRDELIAESAGWPDRIESINEAYKRKLPHLFKDEANEGGNIKFLKDDL